MPAPHPHGSGKIIRGGRQLAEAATIVVPYDTGVDPDDPGSVFTLLAEGHAQGLAGALLTITGIIGGAPRALGAQMAVLAAGR